MKKYFYAALPAALLIASPASAQLGATNDPTPGSASLMNGNFAAAEREIRSSGVSQFDPARSINLGVALAKQGQQGEAAELFNTVLMQDNVEMIVGNGSSVMSHDLARYALASLRDGVLSR